MENLMHSSQRKTSVRFHVWALSVVLKHPHQLHLPNISGRTHFRARDRLEARPQSNRGQSGFVGESNDARGVSIGSVVFVRE